MKQSKQEIWNNILEPVVCIVVLTHHSRLVFLRVGFVILDLGQERSTGLGKEEDQGGEGEGANSGGFVTLVRAVGKMQGVVEA